MAASADDTDTGLFGSAILLVYYNKRLCKVCCDKNMHTDSSDFCIFAGDRGLEVCGYGGGSYVPVDLYHSMCGGHPGLISSASFPDSDYSQPTAQLRNSSHMMGNEEDSQQASHSCKVFLAFI